MKQDVSVRDRIDVQWSVRTRSSIETPLGEAVVTASFTMTLGTYAGQITRSVMADNLNSRGVHEGDITSVKSKDDVVTMDDAMSAMQERGILEEDISKMAIIAVLLDDEFIAQEVLLME